MTKTENKRPIFFLFFFISFLIIGVILFHRAVITVRLYELSQEIEKINQTEKGRNNLDILFKYEMNRKLYFGTINEEEYDRQELKTIRILTTKDPFDASLKKTAHFALPIINLFRFLIGKPKITFQNQSQNQHSLILAYYHESNKRFSEALKIYQTIPEKEKSAPILLHEGYCYSLLEEYEKAYSKLNQIITEYKNEDIAITASILLMHIMDFREESRRVLQNKTESTEKLVKLFQLNSFQNAKLLLERLNSSHRNMDNETKAKIDYYRGRIWEETGEKEKAFQAYQNLILQYPNSPSAKNANRRIVVIAVHHPSRKELLELTKENNSILKDKQFDFFSQLDEKWSSPSQKWKGEEDFLLSPKDLLEYKTRIKKKKTELEKIQTKKMLKKAGDNGEYRIEYYHPNGSISRINHFDPQGNLKGYLLYRYDSRGNRIRIDPYDENGKLIEYYE